MKAPSLPTRDSLRRMASHGTGMNTYLVLTSSEPDPDCRNGDESLTMSVRLVVPDCYSAKTSHRLATSDSWENSIMFNTNTTQGFFY